MQPERKIYPMILELPLSEDAPDLLLGVSRAIARHEGRQSILVLDDGISAVAGVYEHVRNAARSQLVAPCSVECDQVYLFQQFQPPSLPVTLWTIHRKRRSLDNLPLPSALQDRPFARHQDDSLLGRGVADQILPTRILAEVLTGSHLGHLFDETASFIAALQFCQTQDVVVVQHVGSWRKTCDLRAAGARDEGALAYRSRSADDPPHYVSVPLTFPRRHGT